MYFHILYVENTKIFEIIFSKFGVFCVQNKFVSIQWNVFLLRNVQKNVLC
jgi:hypothetical protein